MEHDDEYEEDYEDDEQNNRQIIEENEMKQMEELRITKIESKDEVNTITKTSTKVRIKKPRLPDDVLELQRLLYNYQMEAAEKESSLKMKLMKKEESILEEQHQAQMALYEKQQELAQIQIEYWSNLHH